MMRRFRPNWRTRASVTSRTLAVYAVSMLVTFLLGSVVMHPHEGLIRPAEFKPIVRSHQSLLERGEPHARRA
jgi:hypothetical protein